MKYEWFLEGMAIYVLISFIIIIPTITLSAIDRFDLSIGGGGLGTSGNWELPLIIAGAFIIMQVFCLVIIFIYYHLEVKK